MRNAIVKIDGTVTRKKCDKEIRKAYDRKKLSEDSKQRLVNGKCPTCR